MNKNSYLCRFISEHRDSWEELLSSNPYFLIIKRDGPLAIFNYNMLAEEIIFDDPEAAEGIEVTRWSRGTVPLSPGDEWYEKCTPFAPDGLMYAVGATIDENGVVSGTVIPCTRHRCDFSLPEVQEARGIILNTDTLEVVCWPFRKFGNYGESYADDIDWPSARTQEKIDGSIIKLWYNKLLENWQISTNGIIDGNECEIGTTLKTFKMLFDEAAEKNGLDYSILDKIKTYIFELVGPLNRIVIKYDEVDFYHIGTRNNETGEESNDDIGIKKPKEFPLGSLEDCIAAAAALCDDNEGGRFEVEHEGFVVVDKNWHRIKVKSPEYVMVHHELNNGILSKKKILQLISDNEYEEYLTYFPKHRETFEGYIRKIELLKVSIHEACVKALSIKDSMPDANRSEIAKEIIAQLKGRAGWGFAAINGNSEESIYEKMSEKNLFKELDKF